MLPLLSRSHLRVLAIVAVSGVVLFGCSRHPFSGEFVADNRPSGMVFLSTTQAGAAVNGFLMNVVPDGRGGTTSQTVAVDGSADSDTVTLRAKAALGLINVTLSGRADGKRLVLSGSSSSGRIESLVFSRGNQESFNARLAEWQAVLSAEHEQEEAARIAAESRARAEREEAAAREALVQRAQGAGTAFIASIHRLADAASALDRFTFEGDERRYAQWWATVQGRAQRLQENASGGTAQCWVLKNELGYVKNDTGALKQHSRMLADRAKQLDDLIARVERDVAESERLEAVFSTAAQADATGTIPDAIVGSVSEKARSSRAVVAEAVTRARTRKVAAMEMAAGYERNGDALLVESQKLVASAVCRGR